MASFQQRLKERKLVQWAFAYLAGTWVLYEVADTVGSRWGLPDALRKPPVDLDALDCPSLGLFPVPGPLEFSHPSYDAWNAEERRRADAWQEAYLIWVEETRDNFDRYPQNQVLEFPNTGHMFFLERPEEASRAIREFVLGLE
jgi:pimeloyl-ACP methyl ester carboxylesterase